MPIGQDATRAETLERSPLRGRGGQIARGFSLIDVLVSLAVIGVLISLLLPSLSRVRETTRQVLCASNVRQLGLGVAMYADDWQDRIPLSVYVTPIGHQIPRATNGSPATAVNTINLRLNIEGLWRSPWDGLGRLYSGSYLPASGVFYCPSHVGQHPQSRYENEWGRPIGWIVGNYQYRGQGSNGSTFLGQIEPRRSSLIADAMFDAESPNHMHGLNMLRSDISVSFIVDDSGELYRRFAAMAGGSPSGTGRAWDTLDMVSDPNSNGTSGGGGTPGAQPHRRQ